MQFTFAKNHWILPMHSNVTSKNVSWPHFSWTTLYINQTTLTWGTFRTFFLWASLRNHEQDFLLLRYASFAHLLVSYIKLASVEFYVRILVEFLFACFTLFVRTSENYWAVEVRFSEKKVRNASLSASSCHSYLLTTSTIYSLTYLSIIYAFTC